MSITSRPSRPSTMVVAALALAPLIACDGGPSESLQISAEAAAYLNEVLDVMEAHSLQRQNVSWPAFRAEVFEVAAGAQTRSDTYTAIERALVLLGDGHSTFRTVEGVLLFVNVPQCQAIVVDPPQPPPSIGYVRIRTFPGSAPNPAAYVDDIQSLMATLDGDDVIGWIVDVRGNLGGDQWPMIAAAGPILGEGVVGHSIDGAGVAHEWEYRDGAVLLDGAEMFRVAAPYQLRRPAPPVAVIVDNRTTGAGEAVPIAFRGRADTRSFGQGTCGLSTMTTPFTMSDGGVLHLTTAVMADRTGTAYGGMVVPDVETLGPLQAFDQAIEWLFEQDDAGAR